MQEAGEHPHDRAVCHLARVLSGALPYRPRITASRFPTGSLLWRPPRWDGVADAFVSCCLVGAAGSCRWFMVQCTIPQFSEDFASPEKFFFLARQTPTQRTGCGRICENAHIAMRAAASYVARQTRGKRKARIGREWLQHEPFERAVDANAPHRCPRHTCTNNAAITPANSPNISASARFNAIFGECARPGTSAGSTTAMLLAPTSPITPTSL